MISLTQSYRLVRPQIEPKRIRLGCGTLRRDKIFA